jgi:amino acid adenylation domain-containing protein
VTATTGTGRETAPPPAEAEWSAPLTESQLGLLVVHRAVPVPHLYNIAVELRLDPAVPSVTLRRALAALLEVQPALRLALLDVRAVLGEPPAPADVPLRHVLVGGEFEPRVTRELDDLAATAFDLAHAPLLRAVHLTSADGRHSALLLVVHHTVFDGFSLQPLVRDLTAALAGDLDVGALRPVREAALRRELTAQSRASGESRVEDRARDLGRLLRETPATVLFPHPNRPTTTGFSGERRRIELPAGLSAEIDRTIAELGVSPFAFFSGVLAAVLGRHTGTAPVTFGTPVVARRTIASHDLCGFFVNTLPLVVDVPWRLGFDEYLRTAVAEEVDQVKRSVAVPFNRVVRHADPDRSGNRNPLFSVMLAMQDSTAVAPGGPVHLVREHGTGTAKFDLWLGVTPTPDGWLLELEHDTSLLRPPVVDAVATSLTGALAAVTANPTTPLMELFADASDDETTRADGYWREPAAPDLDGWLGQAAARHPDRIAVEEDARSLTHAELQRRVGEVAAGLRAEGVGPGDVVGLTTETLVDTVVAILAVLRLRAVFLPLDLSLPAERLSYMVGKAGSRVAVGTGDPGVPVFAPAELRDEPVESDGSGTSEDGVYIMFTSGSTGNPKGVLMHNGPLVNLSAWQLDALDMDEHTRFLQYAPLGFDVSFQEVAPTLMAGGAVVSREPADRRDFPAVVRRVRDTCVTHVYLPVAALRPFVQAAEGLDLPDLTHVCVSGEQLIVDEEIRAFFIRHAGARLINLYGPTETHAVTTHRLSAEDGPWPSHVPIGLPITGVTAQVIDRTGHLAPRGVAGELLLGGRCPARGYVNDPERTAERFADDPHAPGGTRYRTGDQVMRDEHGVLVFLGRDDHQVKIRGYRVELGEVENAAQQHPGVQRAVAAARGSGADRHLVLFALADEVDDDALRSRLAEVLPAYMVPARILRVDSVPTTGNGKVDRPALLAIADRLITEERREQRPPAPTAADPLESWLQALWAELLDQPLPPVDRSLLEIGAHSLNVLLALMRIEQEHGVQVPILEFFRAPTVSSLATLVREAKRALA